MTERTAEGVKTVEQWHESLNSGDADRLVALSHPDVRMGGPRGAVTGSEALREWVTRANIRLDPKNFFHHGETVVVEELAEWRSPETGEVAGKVTVASVFVVRDGRVTSITRHEDLQKALDAATLDDSHEAKLE